MEMKNNVNYTKENPKVNEKLYPIDKVDREIMQLEKTCDILSIALKVELALTAVVVVFAFVVSKLPVDLDKAMNEQTSISAQVSYQEEV